MLFSVSDRVDFERAVADILNDTGAGTYCCNLVGIVATNRSIPGVWGTLTIQGSASYWTATLRGIEYTTNNATTVVTLTYSKQAELIANAPLVGWVSDKPY